jgi:hypothetical protein
VTIDVPEEHLGASPSCWRCARAGWSTWSTTAPAGCGSSTSCRRAADRLPHRVPHRDPRHRRAEPHLRGLRAVVRRHPGA